MEQDWILDEVLGNGPSEGDHGNDVLRAATVDTATDEEWHQDRVDDVEAAISDAIEASEYEEKDKYLQFDGPTIFPEEIPYDWKNEELTAPTSISGLREGVGLNSWWLENGRGPLENVNAKGFGTGVDRLRSVSKALYHIADYNGVEPIGVRAEGDVAIVTSLGGGTGSGLALDLASDLKQENTVDSIHLYAVLPRSGAGVDVKTNAHAALSELEYTELTGESPFTTITLLPHLDEVTDRNEAFEMAMVRTIIARHNGGASVDELRPSQMNRVSPPVYAPFTVASPVTLQYDFATREEALEIVMETLQAKRQELDAENRLYDVVEQYLEEGFPNTAGAELAGVRAERRDDFDGHDRRALELQRRIEDDLWGEFLGSDALAVAGLKETVERIDAKFEEICSDESIGVNDDASDLDRAAEFIDMVPERLIGWLETEMEPELTERDQAAYELVKTVRRELENVARRRDLYQAISRITAEEVPELSKRIAETIRTALADVILDEEIQYLPSKITSPRLREMIEDREQELARHEDVLAALGEQYEAVAAEIERMRAEWYDAVWKEAERLAAIKRNEQAISEAVHDLSDRIKRACYEVNRAESEAELDQIELNLDQATPLGNGDKHFDGILPLNKELDRMELEPIPKNEIEDGFESVKRARRLEFAHGGILPWRGNTEEFVTAVRNAERSGWFSINPDRPDVSIEDAFACSFHAEKLDRSAEIDTAREATIDAIVETFVEVFIAGGDEFVSYEPESEYGVDVPRDNSPETVRATLKAALEASVATDADDLLDDVMPVSGIDPSEWSAEPLSDRTSNGDAMEQIFDAYLYPIGKAHEAVREQYGVLADGEHVPGLLSRMKTLRAIAEGRDVVSEPGPGRSVFVDVPDLVDRRFGSMSGNEFAERYEGIYGFDLDDPFNFDNPYVVPKRTDPADLAGDPADIAETEILETRSDDIETEFRRETAKLIQNDERAPYEVALWSNAERIVDTEYKQHRIRQVYLSRAFEEQHRSGAMFTVGKRYDEVYEQYNDREDMPIEANPDMYDAETHPHGWADDVTMVTFVGGIFLDNISLVSEPGGYRDAYQNTYDIAEFPGSHNTIGLGAMWNRWPLLGEWVTEEWEVANSESDADFGGFVYRDKVYDPSNRRFIDEIKYRNATDGESAADLFIDALTADAYENTVQVNQQDTNEPEFKF